MPLLSIEVNKGLDPDELFAFYERNGICEVGFGKEVATRILRYPHLIVAARSGGDLVGLARATFDGVSGHVMELSVDLRYQGTDSRFANGSVVESDREGVGHQLGARLRTELEARGITFVSCYIVAGCEEPLYVALGFSENVGHRVFHIDRRPYVLQRHGAKT